MRHLLLVLAALAAAGCTTYKLWTEYGGGQEEGVIQLSYEFHRFENPQVDERAGIELARERCRDWGFRDAHRKGEDRQCIDGPPGDCSKWRVIREYRCIHEKALPPRS